MINKNSRTYFKIFKAIPAIYDKEVRFVFRSSFEEMHSQCLLITNFDYI